MIEVFIEVPVIIIMRFCENNVLGLGTMCIDVGYVNFGGLQCSNGGPLGWGLGYKLLGSPYIFCLSRYVFCLLFIKTESIKAGPILKLNSASF